MDERDVETIPASPQSEYRVLARKYRPSSFADLIGQDAMVQTLRNAFSANRLAHAYMLTGVRGVGKTTTARILARAFNYAEEGSDAGPTLDMEKPGIHCEAILESRHMDVVEMDAASHTGIDDIRDIIDSAAYRPVSARFKIFIIDEVHMLSKAAFNGLLKTLEEPPDHVKFIFATTEIRKVPITVLSRCQRFDLRRIPGALLAEHLAHVLGQEGVEAESAALALIARAAEGSVRDALSMLDQAIAHSGGEVSAETVRAMLGTADRSQVLDLFEQVMSGRIGEALGLFDRLHGAGADPLAIIDDLAETAHLATRYKLAPELTADQALNEEEIARGTAFAESLPVSALARAWQVLLKGHDEVDRAPRPSHAAEMVLVRLAHMATLPTPEEALRKLSEVEEGTGQSGPSSPSPSGGPVASANMSAGMAEPRSVTSPAPAAKTEPVASAQLTPTIQLEEFEDIVALAESKRDILLKRNLELYARPVRMGHLSVEFALEPDGPQTIYNQLAQSLKEWTGERWMVSPSREAGMPPLRDRQREAEEKRREKLAAHPAVAAVLEQFPDAEMTIRELPDSNLEEHAAPADETTGNGED